MAFVWGFDFFQAQQKTRSWNNPMILLMAEISFPTTWNGAETLSIMGKTTCPSTGEFTGFQGPINSMNGGRIFLGVFHPFGAMGCRHSTYSTFISRRIGPYDLEGRG